MGRKRKIEIDKTREVDGDPSVILRTGERVPRYRQENIDQGQREVWQVGEAELVALEGTRKQGQIWDWAVFERCFVEGVIDRDGDVYFPSLADLARWSGCEYNQVRKNASRKNWTSKKKLFEERIPAMVEEKIAEKLADKLADLEAGLDLEVARMSARRYLREVAEPYLRRLMRRIDGTLVKTDGSVAEPPLPNVDDGVKLLKLLLAVEGEATERVATVSVVQVNLNSQAEATVHALQEAAARGLFEESALPAILALVEEHVARVKWIYREGSSTIDAITDANRIGDSDRVN